MKISKKLSLGFLSIVLLITITGLISVYASQKVLQKRIGNESVFLATNILGHIDRTIYLRIEQLQAYAQDLSEEPILIRSNQEFEKLDNIQEYINKKDRAWRANDTGQINTFMEDLISNELSAEIRDEFELKSFYKERYGYTLFAEVFVTNKYGANAAQTSKTSDYYQADEQWWQEGKENGLYVGDVEFDQSAEIYSIAIGVRVDNDDREFLGVLKAVLNIAEVINVVKAAEEEGYGNLDFKLLTKDNRTIYCTEEFETLKSIPAELATLLQKKDGPHQILPYFIISGDKPGKGKELYSYAHSQGYKSYKGLDWTLVLEQEADEIFAPVAKLRNWILIVSLLITVLAIVIGVIIYRSISIPINELIKATSEVRTGKLDTQIEIKSKDEISDLSNSFNKMTEALRKTTTSMKVLNTANQHLQDSRQHLKATNQKLESEITERKKVEESNKQLITILKATSDFVGFADANDKHIVYINEAGRKMCGIGIDEDVTKLKIPDVHPEWANKKLTEEILPAVVRDGKWQGECAFLNIKDRHEIPVLMVLSSHKAPNGEVTRFSTISHNITERKKTEKELREVRERLEYILSTTPATTYTCKVGDDWGATFISESIRNQFGYKPQQFLEDSGFWLSRIHPEDRQRVLKGLSGLFEKDFCVNEYRFMHQDGSYRWVYDEVRLIRDDQAKPIEAIGYRIYKLDTYTSTIAEAILGAQIQ